MDLKTATHCMNNDIGVYFLGHRYQRIQAIIFRRYVAGEDETKGNRYQLEIFGGHSNSVTIAPMESVKSEE